MNREQAFELLHEWVKSESLRTHCKSVAYAMEEYAREFSLDDNEVEKWFVCGLLHDFDWEKFPNIDEHPRKGCEFLKERGCDDEIIEAILGHNERTGVERKTKMAKALFAVDELCGLVVALAKVRPGAFEGMTPKSVRKAMKKKDFARNVNREDIKKGIEELGVDENAHFEIVIRALQRMENDRS